MAKAGNELLRESIARNVAAVLSLPSAGLLRHHKTRFLSETDQGFWMESIASETPLIEELISKKQPAGVSFKNGTQKAVFMTPILQRTVAYSVNASTTVEAVLLQFPSEVKAIQRRNNYRVAVPSDTELFVRIWRIGEQVYLGDRPMAAQELIATVRNLSLGGLGVVFIGKAGHPPKVTPEDRLRIQLMYGETSLLMEGRMRPPNSSGKPGDPTQLKAGIQFKALENDLEGRQSLAKLTKIVGELQRAEVRRHRMGLATV